MSTAASSLESAKSRCIGVTLSLSVVSRSEYLLGS
jgi:hypothetical protein